MAVRLYLIFRSQHLSSVTGRLYRVKLSSWSGLRLYASTSSLSVSNRDKSCSLSIAIFCQSMWNEIVFPTFYQMWKSLKSSIRHAQSEAREKKSVAYSGSMHFVILDCRVLKSPADAVLNLAIRIKGWCAVFHFRFHSSCFSLLKFNFMPYNSTRLWWLQNWDKN